MLLGWLTAVTPLRCHVIYKRLATVVGGQVGSPYSSNI